jgi:thiol:disulfide interchange protein/DsbC/DsbD-like thiol-disulfide interchange protein
MFPARRLLTTLCLLFALPLTHAANLLSANAPSHVKASLVAADTAVHAGRPIDVALRLVHDAHWHTYWINPGTGLATAITWKLPPGWIAGPIRWPTPGVLRDHTGTIIGQGYEGDLLLPVTLTPPANLAPGTNVTLRANVEWLMCDEVCMPGNAEVTINLPVSKEATPRDTEWGPKIAAVIAALPTADASWQVRANRAGKTIMLDISPAATAPHVPKDLRFFSEDGLIAYDLPQSVKPNSRGGFLLTLPLALDGPKDPPKLLGVLSSENGWRADGSLRGLAIAAEIQSAATTTTTNATSGAAGAPSATGLAGTLLLAFVGGLILNLMPCVFPVLGLKILGFVNQAGHQRSRIVAHGLIFTGGVLVSFWTLAAALTVLRAGGDQLGWGFQLQSPVFVFGLAVLLLVFALNMSGVFEFGLRATAVGANLQSKSGYAGSFFTGVLATVVATPCSAPFLAPALGAALAVAPAASWAIFTAIGVGLSTPYLLLSIFPQAVKVLPRPGAWMETFKQFMAFPLYGTVGYLIWVLAAQTSEEGFRNVLFALVWVALAVWIFGRWNAPGASAGRTRFGMAGLIVCGAIGLWVGWPRTVVANTAHGSGVEAVTWQTWSPEAVAQLRAEGRVIYVDFTARWCATCQANKRLVFHDDEILKYFAFHHIAALRGDWTNQDPRITAELAKYHRSAVPFNVIWLPGKDDPVILPELLTPSTVLAAFHVGSGGALADKGN